MGSKLSILYVENLYFQIPNVIFCISVFSHNGPNIKPLNYCLPNHALSGFFSDIVNGDTSVLEKEGAVR